MDTAINGQNGIVILCQTYWREKVRWCSGFVEGRVGFAFANPEIDIPAITERVIHNVRSGKTDADYVWFTQHSSWPTDI